LVEGAAGIAPWLLDPSLETPNASAFEDYKAQINVMPRVAFSFPISDEASFFAQFLFLHAAKPDFAWLRSVFQPAFRHTETSSPRFCYKSTFLGPI
jgi:hypothetical protein